MYIRAVMHSCAVIPVRLHRYIRVSYCLIDGKTYSARIALVVFLRTADILVEISTVCLHLEISIA